MALNWLHRLLLYKLPGPHIVPVTGVVGLISLSSLSDFLSRDWSVVVAGVRLDEEMDTDTRGRIYTEVNQYAEANDQDAVFWYPLRYRA